MPRDFSKYYAAVAADNAWQAEIDRLYGEAHGSFVRYTSRSHGAEGTLLRALYIDRAAKVDAWLAISGSLSGLQPV